MNIQLTNGVTNKKQLTNAFNERKWVAFLNCVGRLVKPFTNRIIRLSNQKKKLRMLIEGCWLTAYSIGQLLICVIRLVINLINFRLIKRNAVYEGLSAPIIVRYPHIRCTLIFPNLKKLSPEIKFWILINLLQPSGVS